MSCHGASATPGAADIDHSFRVDRATCTQCHATGVPEERRNGAGRTLQERARALIRELRGACGEPDAVDVEHSKPAQLAPCARDADEATALFLALLVSEDDAAALHNSPFAGRLLDQAESILQRLPGAAAPRAPSP